jgi:hypothetical protein
MHHNIRNASLALGLGLGAVHAHAGTVTLPLGAEHTGAFIQNYFNGGTDSVPTDGTGPNLGIAFSPNANVQKAGSNAATGAGKFENNPSGQSEILYFAFANPATPNAMNYAAGFTGLNFNYSLSTNSSQFNGGVVNIWSGLNGTGTLLDSLTLNAAPTTVACSTRLDAYCTWSALSTGTLAGVAQSATFATNSTAQFTEFDGIRLTTPVPLPAAAWLMISGIAGSFGFVRRRRQATA